MGSNKLYIDNSNTRMPLIYGDFDIDRVGINTNNPRFELHVKDGNDAGTEASLFIEPQKWNAPGDFGELRVGDPFHYLRAEFSVGMTLYDFNQILFRVGGANAPIRMQIANNGNVGIGLAGNPTARLHTSGTVRLENLALDNSLNRILVVDPNGNVFIKTVSSLVNTNCTTVNTLPKVSNTAGDLTCSQIFDNGTHVGIGTATPSEKLEVNGNIRTNISLIASDKRFKKDIQPVTKALSKINQLTGVGYSYRTEEFAKSNLPAGKSLGFIAQDIEKVFPELVHRNAEGYMSVNYDGLIPVLVEAIKEQQAQIEELKALVRQQPDAHR
ncbi:MAG: tail fiber domain-containing protein [Bacteroidia bacterium]|nr:tail fiber domain-containing protein [Bacteroidia bacterium]